MKKAEIHFIRQARIINTANQFYSENERFPERTELQKLTGFSSGIVRDELERIKEKTGVYYASEVDRSEAGRRARNARIIRNKEMNQNKKQQKEDEKFQLIISAAEKYKAEKNRYPERRKLAELTGFGTATVTQAAAKIFKQTNIWYVHNLTPEERGQRSKMSREGNEYELL